MFAVCSLGERIADSNPPSGRSMPDLLDDAVKGVVDDVLLPI